MKNEMRHKKNSKVSLYVLVTVNSRGQVFLTVEDICRNQYIDHSDSNRVSKLWVLAYCRGMTSIQVGKKKSVIVIHRVEYMKNV